MDGFSKEYIKLQFVDRGSHLLIQDDNKIVIYDQDPPKSYFFEGKKIKNYFFYYYKLLIHYDDNTVDIIYRDSNTYEIKQYQIDKKEIVYICLIMIKQTEYLVVFTTKDVAMLDLKDFNNTWDFDIQGEKLIYDELVNVSKFQDRICLLNRTGVSVFHITENALHQFNMEIPNVQKTILFPDNHILVHFINTQNNHVISLYYLHPITKKFLFVNSKEFHPELEINDMFATLKNVLVFWKNEYNQYGIMSIDLESTFELEIHAEEKEASEIGSKGADTMAVEAEEVKQITEN